MKDYIFGSIGLIFWLAGIVLAKGSAKILAFLFIPYSWYLVVERVMGMYGLI